MAMHELTVEKKNPQRGCWECVAIFVADESAEWDLVAIASRFMVLHCHNGVDCRLIMEPHTLECFHEQMRRRKEEGRSLGYLSFYPDGRIAIQVKGLPQEQNDSSPQCHT